MTVHIIGAGIAGLSAAYRLTKKDIPVIVYDAAGHAGGRCHSFFDKKLNAVTDEGTHLILGANTALLNMIADCDTTKMPVDSGTDMLFYGVKSEKSFVVSTNHPLKALPAFFKIKNRLIESIMNTPASQADSVLFYNTLLRCFGSKNGRIFHAVPSLNDCLIRPVENFLTQRGVPFRFGMTLRFVGNDKLTFLNKPDVLLAPNDGVILALPVMNLSRLVVGVPELPTSAIVNIHYKSNAVLPNTVPCAVLLEGIGHFVSVRNGVVSVTVSAADDLLNTYSKAVIAGTLWGEIAPLLSVGSSVPPYRFIADRHATLFQDRSTNALRPETNIGIPRVFLAGDETKTGFPCTLEGAVRSGFAAADAFF